MINIIAYSGGKDSTALLCWAIREKMEFRALFCDTGWEHDLTYKYIEYINEKLLGGGLITVSSDKYSGMPDMVEKKMRVPSTKARFCTEQLKIIPMINWIKKQDDDVTVFQGIRADESHSRSKMPMREFSDSYDAWVERPLLKWKAEDCFEIIKSFGLEPNPLYKLGAKRVGCFPCIMTTHGELKRVQKMLPEVWDRIALLENKAGSGFFPPMYIPERFQTGYDPKSGKPFCKMEDVKLYLENNQVDLYEESPSCMSIYNLCE